MNHLLCPRCFNRATYPIKPSALTYPASLEGGLLSSSVLASIGAGISRSHGISPIVGVAVGTITGMALSVLQEQGSLSNRSCLRLGRNEEVSYFCQNCCYVFTPKTVQAEAVASLT